MDFTATLPGKRMAAAVLFFDTADRILLVEPAYRELHWELSGGCIEATNLPEPPLSAKFRKNSV